MRILFVPTWKCNLQCGYCNLRTEINPDGSYAMSDRLVEGVLHDRPAGDWLAAFNRLPPSHLEMTGGDPTMYDGLPELVDGLPKDWTWSITSNTLRVEVIERLNVLRCLSWTASYHYHSGDTFTKGLGILRAKGLHPPVTLVVTPARMADAYIKVKELVEAGYWVNIHRALTTGFSWREEPYLSLWDGFIRMLHGFPVHIVSNIPPDYTGNRYRFCKAGKEYIAAGPDGRVYRCFSHLTAGKPFGTIDDLQLREWATCGEVDCTCSYDIDQNKPEK